jgi:RND family efflux transporter MFP subunit
MNPLRHTRRLFVWLACTLFLAGCHRAVAPADENVPMAPVKAAAPEAVELAEWSDLIASTQPLPDQMARITSTVPGPVVRVLRDGKGKSLVEGQRVDKDQVIAQLDDRVARAQRDKTVAMIEELQEMKIQADLAKQLAQLDFDRLQKLYPVNTGPGQGGLISKIEIEKARLALQDSESKQKAAQAKEKSLRLELKSLDVHLEYHELRAPLNGYLGALQVAPGQTLSAGTIVAEVVNLDEIDVVAFASPHAAAKLRVGQDAKLIGKDHQPEAQATGRHDAVKGTITYIAVQAQSETGNFLIKARFPNKDLRYRSNQVVRLDVETQKKKQRLVISESALMEDHDPPFVVIAEDVQTKKNKDGEDEKIGKARKLHAYLGVRDRVNHTVEILRLEDPEKKEAPAVANTLFIVEGGHGLHDGDPVKIDLVKAEEAKHP